MNGVLPTFRASCAVLLALSPALAQEPGSGGVWDQAVGEPRLVRCSEQPPVGAGTGCLQLDVSMTPEMSGREWGIEAERRRWTGAVGTEVMEIRRVEISDALAPELVLLVLFDVSGSMRSGDALSWSRSAIRGLLQQMQPFQVQAAVAPFGSRRVAQTIRALPFGNIENALSQLERMREPRDENTALYSALREGSLRVRSKVDSLRTEGRSARGAIVVLTDGENDVGHPGDDPDLLATRADLSYARQTAVDGGLRVIAVGVGPSVNSEELTGLADAVIQTDVRVSGLVGSMDQVFGELQTGRRLTFSLAPAARLLLGRGERGVLVTFDDLAGTARFSARTDWRPPFTAAPAFMPAGSERAAYGGFEPGSRGRLYGLAAILLLGWMCLWIASPLLVRVATGASAKPAMASGPQLDGPPGSRPPEAAPSSGEAALAPETLNIVDAEPRPLDSPTMQKASLDRV